MNPPVYPAIFHREEEGDYSVFFPDLPYSTCGETLEQAFLMACDVLRIWLEQPDPLMGHPSPTPYEEVKGEEGDIVLLVCPILYEGK